MADGIEYTVNTRFTGEDDLRRAEAGFQRLDRAASKVGQSDRFGKAMRSDLGKLGATLGITGLSIYGVKAAVENLYGALRSGAALQTTTERFTKLAASIDTTADALLGRLREATHGMISDAELMASASGIISLRLADNADQVVRLATVVGTLGWDMQQVILTFANLSTMRLDALGLSVDEVKNKQKELMAQGMSTAAAFKEAVIQAGEARLDVGGVSEAEQSFKQAEAAVANYKNELLLSITATLQQAGAFTELSNAAANMQGHRDLRAEMDALRESGDLTFWQWVKLLDIMSGAGSVAAQAALDQIKIRDALTDTEDELNDQAGAWQVWARNVAIQTGYAAQQAAADMNQIFYGLIGLRDGLGDNAPFTPRQDDFDYMAAGAEIGSQRNLRQRQAEWMRASMRRSWAADDARAEQVRQEEQALRSYGGALSYVSEEEQKAAEARQRFISAFNAELTAKPEDGLITAEGVVNAEAMNRALYEQVEAAGASATTLALLGVATGQFSEQQAEAALKAAILQEQINQIAEAVVAGKMTLEGALGALGEAQANLNQADLITVAQGATAVPEADRTVQVEADTTLAEGAITGVQTSLTTLTADPYLATLDVDIENVLTGTDAAKRALEGVPSAITVTVNWAQAGADILGALRALGLIQ